MRQPGPKKRVLVVEDNEDVRKVVSIYLKSTGFEVIEAGDGLAGLEQAQSKHPDIILLDVLLPRLDGIEALKRLRGAEWGEDIPVIMMSAVLQTKDIMTETARLDVAAFLQKPFQVRTLVEEIRKALESRAPAGDANAQAPSSQEEKKPEPEEPEEPLTNAPVEIPGLGTLEEHSLPQIVHSVFAAARTGRLRVVMGTTEKRIYFQNGLPVFAESSIPEETLGAHLVERGLITERQHADVRAEMTLGGRQFGEVVLKKGLMGPHELYTELEAHLARKVVTTFAWKMGRFKFEDDDSWKDDVIIARMKPGRIIMDGVQRYWSRAEMAAALPLARAGAILLLGDSPYDDNQLDLTGREVKVLNELRRRPRFDEVIEKDAGHDFTVAVLFALWIMQRVGFERKEGTGARGEDDTGGRTPDEDRPSTVKNEEYAKELMAEYLKYRTADYFKLLGLTREATNEEIVQAFKDRRRRYHPNTLVGIDTGLVHEKIEELFVRVHTAYRTLMDPAARRKYERDLEGGAQRTMLFTKSQTGKITTAEPKDEDQRLFEEAFSLLRNGDFERALPLFESAERLAKKPRYSAYRAWTAYLVSPKKHAAATEKELVSLHKANPDDPLMAYLLGNWNLREKQVKKAIVYFERALEIDPQHIDSARQLRILRMRQKTETSGLFDLFKKK